MSKSSLSILFASYSLWALSACGPNVSVQSGSGTLDGSGGASLTNASESYAYSFDYNGCKTGRQVADSRPGYCRNLANDELNNHCAEWMRKNAFEKGGCAGLGVAWAPITEDVDSESTLTEID